MSEANSELFLLLPLLFLKFTTKRAKKLPQRIERKRDSIEFERSENQGNFSFPVLLIIFKFLNAFKHAEILYLQGIQNIYDTVYLAI